MKRLTPGREKEIREELRLEGGGGVTEELLAEIDALRDIVYHSSGLALYHAQHAYMLVEELKKERDQLQNSLKAGQILISNGPIERCYICPKCERMSQGTECKYCLKELDNE